MGKTKKERKGPRTNPTGIPSVAEVQKEEENKQKSYPLIEQVGDLQTSVYLD
jgi:hypothetical protein